MRVTLVGADFEENLALCMLSAVAERDGHRATVVAFDDEAKRDEVVLAIVKSRPDVVGLSMQFQHRAHEFMRLAARLRDAGFRGHLTCGGQFPTMAWDYVLGPTTPFDSVVLYDGEDTFAELLAALDQDTPLADVAGLALRGALGPRRTAGRRFREDLDALPIAKRYRRPNVHAGVPFIPMSGGRGCWGACSYCSITTFYRDGRAAGGGKTVRMRSAPDVAEEMAMLWHAAGGRAIFCFHDDNFLLPRAKDTLARVGEMRKGLDELGVGRAALVGKARPDCLDADLAKALRALGVVRLYVGVENASVDGGVHLGRGRQGQHVREALAACREAGIFACYNLLIFEPGTTLDHVRDNVAFIREHADHPVNFCRAEPYHGTPLHAQLQKSGKLTGSILGWDYRIDDDRAELLFRICASAFRHRNFASRGVANRYMGLGYVAKLVEFFHDDSAERRVALRRAAELTRAISLDTAEHLEQALRFVETVDLADRDRIERETALLGLRVAASDRVFHARLDEAFAALEKITGRSSGGVRAVPRKLARLAERAGLAALVSLSAAATASACGGKESGGGGTVSDPLPDDGGQVVDPLPADSGLRDVGSDARDAGGDGKDAGSDVTVVDPPPPDAGMQGLLDEPMRERRGTDHWRDTTPSRAVRSGDLPLFDPPQIQMHATRDGSSVRVHVRGGPAAVTTRFDAEGNVEGEGRAVVWTPATRDDTLTVAVRSAGGVSVAQLRACDV